MGHTFAREQCVVVTTTTTTTNNDDNNDNNNDTNSSTCAYMNNLCNFGACPRKVRYGQIAGTTPCSLFNMASTNVRVLWWAQS